MLVGSWGQSVKAFGPFDDPDDAREMCNLLGIPGASWQVVPLSRLA